MKIFNILGLIFLIWSSLIHAQQIHFEKVAPLSPTIQNTTPFCGLKDSTVAFADIDNDGDQDIMMSGQNINNDYITQLFKNDGNGNFSIVGGTNFPQLAFSTIGFADIDNDNDQDLLLTGFLTFSNPLTKLYRNDGTGNFTEIPGVIENFKGDFAFFDADNDGDLDLITMGEYSASDTPILYLNDGTGNFTPTSQSFYSQYFSALAVADVDGDNDLDIFMTGSNASKLYINNGNANFSLVYNGITTVIYGDVVFLDMDNDGDQDLLISGECSYDTKISKLYLNDGTGNFTEDPQPFDGVREAEIAVVDVNNDNYKDIVIAGEIDSQNYSTKLYMNNGNGDYTPANQPFVELSKAAIGVADIDGDNDKDLLMIGRDIYYLVYARLYVNDGSGNFMDVSDLPFPGVMMSSADFADIDNDNDLDVLITGWGNYRHRISKLFKNDGMGNYTEVPNVPFPGLNRSSAAFADVDGDNDVDVVITGAVAYQTPVTQLFLNDGNGNFSLDTNANFPGFYNSAIEFADIDGDNDMDLLLTGVIEGTLQLGNVKMYKNDGNGNFTEVPNLPFDGVFNSKLKFIDVDGDNDLDVLIAGRIKNTDDSTKLFFNDGAGNFTLDTNNVFVELAQPAIDFADIDGDNDLDFFITGYDIPSQISIAKLYKNDGTGVFTEVVNTGILGVNKSESKFADIDGDNAPDLITTGTRVTGEIHTEIYLNDGSGVFTQVATHPLMDVTLGTLNFADIDNDNDTDVLLTGVSFCNGNVAYLYKNYSTPSEINTWDGDNNFVSVYPNPLKSVFHIDTNGLKIFEIHLYNMAGEEMLFDYNPDNKEVKVNLPEGIYLVKITLESSVVNQKIIIN